MRLRIHHSLFAGFLGVVGLLVVLILLLVGSGLRRDLRATFQAELGRNLELSEAIVSASIGAEPDSLARSITRRITYRVTLIDTSGVVVGDSDVSYADLAAVENHADRPEVAAVLSRREAMSFAERTSATVGASSLYGARLATLDGAPVVVRIAAPQTDIDRAVGRVLGTIAGTGLIAMLLALVAAYAISVAFARPLVALADRARAMTKGDFSSRVPRARVAELHDLSMAFQRLSEQLVARLSDSSRERDEMQALIDCMAEGVVALSEDGRIMRTNRAARSLLALPELDGPGTSSMASLVRNPDLRRALQGSVTEHEQSTEIVLRGRHLLMASRALDQGGSVATFLDITEVRRLEQVRRDFVANASHELRTPLTAIRGFAEALVEDDPDEELRRKFLTLIANNTLRLQRLVEELLDLSRLESGGWSAGRDVVDAGSLLEEAWGLISPEPETDRDFGVEGSGVVLGDRQGLLQVFRNLFENAARHTEPGGRIRCRVESVDGEGSVEIVVEDDGEGIPAHAIPRIFERFYRADSSRARDFGGTGLGLAIAKHLVGSMHGSIRVESELGRGTRFVIRLPSPQESGRARRAPLLQD